MQYFAADGDNCSFRSVREVVLARPGFSAERPFGRFEIAQTALQPLQIEQIDRRMECDDVLLVLLAAQQRRQAELLKLRKG